MSTFVEATASLSVSDDSISSPQSQSKVEVVRFLIKIPSPEVTGQTFGATLKTNKPIPVSMVVFNKSSVYVWVGSPAEEASASENENAGSAGIEMGSLNVAFPRTNYGGSTDGGGGFPISTTLLNSPRDDDSTSGAMAGRISKKTGWPVYLSLNSHVLEQSEDSGDFGLGGSVLAWVERGVVLAVEREKAKVEKNLVK